MPATASAPNWNAIAQIVLVGRTITAARYMTDQEARDMGWFSRPVVLILDNGTILFPSSDSEGNDGGSFLVQEAPSGVSELPAIR